MPARNIDQVLKDLGWAEGVAIPVANEENKKIEKEVEERLKRKAELIITLEESEDRLKSMSNMSKNIDQEKERNEHVITTLRGQLESDLTSLRNLQNQYKTTLKQSNTMKIELENIKERDTKNREEIEKLNTRIEELKHEIEWAEETLFAWEEDLARCEQDNTFMEYVTHKDNQALAKLYNEVKMAREDNFTVKNILDHTVNQVISLETELTTSCSIVRNINKEKARLIDDWQSAMGLIKLKDNEIHNKQVEYDQLKKSLRKKYQKFLHRRSGYEKQKRANDTLEEDGKKIKDNTHKVKFNNMERKTELIQISNEYEIYQSSLVNLASKVESLRASMKELKKTFPPKILQAKTLREENAKILSAINSIDLESMTEEQKTHDASEVFKMGQKANLRILKELDRTQEVICKLQNEIPTIKQDIANRIDELSDLKNLDEHLTIKIDDSQEEISQLDMEVYKQEYELMDLDGEIFETKLKARTKTTGAWLKMLKQLEEKITEKKTFLNEIKGELKRAQDKLSMTKSRWRRVQSEKDRYNEEINRLTNVVANLEREIQASQAGYDETQLRLNMVKVQAKALRETVSRGGSSASKLERESIALQSAMRERQLEIDSQREMLNAKKKNLMEEKSSLKKSIEHLNMKVTQMQKKFEIALGMFGRTSEGEQISATHFKIKVAQEKYELQQHGDQLEAKILKSEKEIEAMESTLRVMTSCNESYKRNLDPVPEHGPEMEEKRNLEIEFFRASTDLKEKTSLKEQIDAEIQELEEKINELDEEEHQIQKEWSIKDKELSDLERDLAKKQLQLERASKHLTQLKTMVAKLKDPPHFKFLTQKDLEIKMKSEQNNSGIQQMAELASNFVETYPMVSRYLEEKGIKLPQKSYHSHTPSKSSYPVSLVSVSGRSLGNTTQDQTTDSGRDGSVCRLDKPGKDACGRESSCDS